MLGADRVKWSLEVSGRDATLKLEVWVDSADGASRCEHGGEREYGGRGERLYEGRGAGGPGSRDGEHYRTWRAGAIKMVVETRGTDAQGE